MNKFFEYAKRLVRPSSDVPMIKSVDEVDVKDPNSALFDMIFGIDPVTGLPVGDLSIYLGKNANPEIKAFIESQLLQENPTIDGLSNLPTEVTNKFGTLSDDDIAKFSRSHGESREDYATRLKAYFAEERAQRAKAKSDAEYQRLIDKVNGKS